VPKLLALGHEVVVYDVQWFGCHLVPNARLVVEKRDIRDYVPLAGFDAVIHLAAVANDPQCELDGKLAWEVNALATARLIDHAARHKIGRFIYASSGSVYGVSKAERVCEDEVLEPISDYNKTKMVAERVVLSYSDRMVVQILRPGTVCGVSPRQRLDTMVNSFAIQACQHGKIIVFGGSQVRPNVHMEDVCAAYIFMLENPKLTGVYNAAFENLTVMEIAQAVQREVSGSVEIAVAESNDVRSYRQCSDKLLSCGFEPVKSVKDGIQDVMRAYFDDGLRDEIGYYNVKAMPKVP
jgi:nucleoside-diphosphate-sugar epimerase